MSGAPKQTPLYDGKLDLNDLMGLTGMATMQPKVDLYTARALHVSLKQKHRSIVQH